MSFSVSSIENKIEKNASLINFNSNKFIVWGRSGWNGNDEVWLGRGHGETLSDYVSRYITPYPAQINRMVFYFDREMTGGWPDSAEFKFQIHKEYPVSGAGSEISNPPCTGTPAEGSGVQIFPATSGDWYTVSKSDPICFNNGSDPRNSNTGGLRGCSYLEVFTDLTIESFSAISVVIDGNLSLTTNPGELSVEIYFKNI